MTEVPAPSPNHSRRTAPVSVIVLHDTGSRTAESTLDWFRRETAGVSSHVVIDRDGTVYRCVPDNRVAWHAGASAMFGAPRVNDVSLGVELVDADDGTPYPPPQLAAAAEWCAEACRKYAIPLNRVVGHSDIAVPLGRKVDPGRDFPWYAFLLDVARRVEPE